MNQVTFLTHPTGTWQITLENGALVGLSLCKHPQSSGILSRELRLHAQAVCAYMDGEIDPYPLPLMPAGTAFQQHVWRCLQTIPYGQRVSYSDMARLSGHARAVRAVASACARNPIALVIPCHRVIAKTGGLGGYAYGLDVKKRLLERELEYLDRKRVQAA